MQVTVILLRLTESQPINVNITPDYWHLSNSILNFSCVFVIFFCVEDKMNKTNKTKQKSFLTWKQILSTVNKLFEAFIFAYGTTRTNDYE